MNRVNQSLMLVLLSGAVDCANAQSTTTPPVTAGQSNTPPAKAEQAKKAPLFPIQVGGANSHVWFTPMLRQNWTDVLDGGGGAAAPDGSSAQAGNIQGATFSYSRDAVANNDTWSAKGAAIPELRLWLPSHGAGFHLDDLSIAPIVAIDKVASSKITSNNVDHLYFAAAAGMQIVHYPKTKSDDRPDGDAYAPRAITWGGQFRGGFVYDTDTQLRASLPGGMFEFEPLFMYHIDTKDAATKVYPEPWYALGWHNRLGGDKDNKPLLKWQLRSWFHLEGGDIQQNATNWNVVKGSFLRMGPEVKGQITVPRWNDFSISAEYDYVPTVNGPKGRDYLYTITGSLPLALSGMGGSSKSPASKTPKNPIALTASYRKGGLVLSKQPVDLFTIGLSLTY